MTSHFPSKYAYPIFSPSSSAHTLRSLIHPRQHCGEKHQISPEHAVTARLFISAISNIARVFFSSLLDTRKRNGAVPPFAANVLLLQSRVLAEKGSGP